MANMGFIMPRPGFLAGVQELCRKSGALFVLDEVITGFRLGIGGAQGAWGLEPDLTCLGKVIGGGLPLGAYGGKRAIMEMVAPAGPVYQAGTLSGNPLATTAGLATLKSLLEPGTFAAIETTARELATGIGRLADDARVPIQIGQSGTIFGFYFLKEAGAEIARRRVGQTPCRYGAILEVLPSHAGAGHLLRAQSVRGGVHQCGACARARWRPRSERQRQVFAGWPARRSEPEARCIQASAFTIGIRLIS